MKFDGEFSVAASPDEMWEFMLDPEKVGPCIPNCQNVEVIDDEHYTAEIGVSVSKISVTFDVNAEVVEQREEEYLQLHLEGDSKDDDSRMESRVSVHMSEGENGTTDVEWENEVDVRGRIMNMGSRIVRRVGLRQTNKTVANVQDELGRPETEESSSFL